MVKQGRSVAQADPIREAAHRAYHGARDGGHGRTGHVDACFARRELLAGLAP